MPTDDGFFGKTAKVVSIPALIISGIALFVSYSAFQLQKRVADRAWRAQLISTIYETVDCPNLRCPPKASLRSRQEATKAYVTLQHEYGERINLGMANLSLMVFEKGKGEDLNFSNADISGATLEGTNFTGVNLRGATFVGADLVKVVMVNADLRGADFTNAGLQGGNFSGAHLEGVRLGNATLGVCGEQQFDAATGEAYRSADLNHATFGDATLDGIFLCGVNLRGADLSNVKNLSSERLNQADGDKDTKLPSYLSRPTTWEKGK